MTEKKKILIVDDDFDVLEQVGSILEKAGYSVDAAQGREEAEEALLDAKPDLAILDLMMEEMDSGFVLAHHVKKLYADTPVILLTAVTSQTGMSFAQGSGGARSWVKADVVMDKPVRGDQLVNEVRRLLAR